MKRVFEDYKNLSDNLTTLFLDSDNNDHDFKIKTEDKTFFCHRSFLKYRSEYFAGMFRSNYQENQQGEITFPDISTKTMEKVLLFLYTGKVEMDQDNAVDLLLVANKLLIETLKKFCEQYVSANLSAENIFDVCEIAAHFACEYLQKKCLKYINMHTESLFSHRGFLQISETLMELILKSDFLMINKEINLLHLLVKWGQKQAKQFVQDRVKGIQTEAVCEEIGHLLKYIRFVSLSQIEYNSVKELKIIPKDLEPKTDLVFLRPRSSRYFLKSVILKESREYQEAIQNWINDKEFLQNMELRFTYDKDGTRGEDFYRICGGAGKSLVVIHSTNGNIFGGYTVVGWPATPTSNAVYDRDAFMFTLKNPLGLPPEKFSVINGKENMAVYSISSYGPVFGGGYDLSIQTDMKNGNFNFGYTFQTPAGITYGSTQAQNFLTGAANFQVQKMEVFCQKK
ncbi:pep-cterm sorting domain-containing protein [Anaeramoeba ignava]|uniref:Pep-cterm sorting domain-containing protein n=1 Tax=Anaeramoeba ignava TaxID=1746090 RepID=A0A9Q0LJ48_ANAIG|nr:pep-cterm sorting domain-containing protein [Anaeramoeba ignava]